MRVLITRAEPAASRSARKLEALGFEAIVVPLFEICDTGNELPEKSYDGVVFTSSNAAVVLAERGWHSDSISNVAYCVGENTATAASALGFGDVISAEGGGRALAKLILMQMGNAPKRLLYPAPTKRAFDLVSEMKTGGAHVDMVEIYAHKKRKPTPAELGNLAAKLSNGIVTAYSADSAKYTAKILAGTFGRDREFRPFLVAISENTAETVLKYPWGGVYVAERPNEAAMIEKIQNLTLRKVDKGHIL